MGLGSEGQSSLCPLSTLETDTSPGPGDVGFGPSWGLVRAYFLTGSYPAKIVPQPDVTRIDVAEMPGGEKTMASRLEQQIEQIELRGKPSDEARGEGDDLVPVPAPCAEPHGDQPKQQSDNHRLHDNVEPDAWNGGRGSGPNDWHCIPE